MSKRMIASAVLILLVGVLSIFARQSAGAETKEKKVLVTTLENIGRPYEIIAPFPAIIYQEFPRMGARDPLESAAIKALEAAGTVAAKYGADAVVGTRIEFNSRTGVDEGRVLVYGTLVKFR